MGQAKQRGSFEQRKAEGIAKQQQQAADRQAKEDAIEAAKTPAQRASSKRAALILAAMAGIIGSSKHY